MSGVKRTTYSTVPSVDLPDFMEDVIETRRWRAAYGLGSTSYVGGHILSRCYGPNRWVAVVYRLPEPEAKAFRYLAEARRWACSTLRHARERDDARSAA